MEVQDFIILQAPVVLLRVWELLQQHCTLWGFHAAWENLRRLFLADSSVWGAECSLWVMATVKPARGY